MTLRYNTNIFCLRRHPTIPPFGKSGLRKKGDCSPFMTKRFVSVMLYVQVVEGFIIHGFKLF